MPTVEELQATIDALNARTAAYDVQITDLQQQLLDAQHAIDVAREDCAKQIFEAEESHNAKAKQLIADANAGLNSAQAMVDLFRRRWETQNVYVVALEQQSTEGIAEAIKQHESAKRAVEIERLKAMG